MSRSAPSSFSPEVSELQTVAHTIRETIAHFFDNEDTETAATPVTGHTLRDIGVDPTIYDNL